MKTVFILLCTAVHNKVVQLHKRGALSTDVWPSAVCVQQRMEVTISRKITSQSMSLPGTYITNLYPGKNVNLRCQSSPALLSSHRAHKWSVTQVNHALPI